MRKIVRSAAVLFFAMVILGGCGSPSFDKESGKAVNEAKTAFRQKSKKQNEKAASIEFYLPFGFEVEKKTENNVILKNGAKKYILFYNPHEERESRVVYEASLAQYDNPEVTEEFSGKGKFGYIIIKELDDEGMSAMTTGVGGVKVTTETKTGSLDEEAKTMMQIANSVEFK